MITIMDIAVYLFIFTQGFSCININFHVPRYVRNEEHVWLNCSSDIVPLGHYTEFILNGETLDSLERRKTGCFSAITRAKCSSNVCHCSQDAKQYAVRIYVHQQLRDLTVECLMKFKSIEPLFVKRKSKIRVLYLSRPNIEKYGEEVFVAGTNRILRCNVITPLNLQMYWNCLNISSYPPIRYNSTLTIMASIEAKSSDQGKICTCMVQYENFVTSTSFVLNVSSPPIIQVSNATVCNQTSDVYLLCKLSGDLNHYGFSQWKHTVNGKFIRKLNGRTHGNISTLLIQSCSHEDVGHYTCIAWNKINRTKYWSNRTTVLTGQDIPVIISTETITEPELAFVVLYYSVPSPVDVQWFRYREKLENSTLYLFSSIKQSVHVPIHRTKIVYDGYRSRLGVLQPLSGVYIAVLKNKIGEAKHYFRWQPVIPTTSASVETKCSDQKVSDTTVFNFQNILWVVTGVVIFIATAGITGICINLGTVQGDANIHRNAKPVAIYYAAPEEEDNTHVYNETDDSMNASTGQYEEISDNYEDINTTDVHERQYDVTHHYNEIDI